MQMIQPNSNCRHIENRWSIEMLSSLLYSLIFFRAFCLLKPDAIPFIDKILNQLRDERFTIGHCKMVQLSRDCANCLFMQEFGEVSPLLPDLIDSVCVGPVVALELFGQNAIRRLIDILGEFSISRLWTVNGK